MTFLNYLSLLGVQQHIRPTQIIVHGDALPQGDWWRRAVKDVANIYFVNVTGRLPTHVYGIPLKCVEHRTDILRYQILYGIVTFTSAETVQCLAASVAAHRDSAPLL